MPLGIFGISSAGSKPSQLESSSRGAIATSDGKDWRGTVVKLPSHTVTLEKRLAEGGFAIVYLASDKRGHQYALKRQFISDDSRQLEACRRECRIVSCLSGHKNIVSYVDHMILKNNSGVYECSLLTAYYKNSVLHLMNERHMAGRCLSANEILKIFCDVCEAVARLHHSQTPVIHRDLKVENVLIDERQRNAPIYVLCDFGSATTKVLSSDTHSLQYIEEEIHRYTTLSYRAPEMIDIYAGRPIGSKIDIWALGVMLYRICYFTLPFGESSLAIQNCSYTFPNEPSHLEELNAIIKMLLEHDQNCRPDIYQVSTLAFEAIGQRCPVGNLNKTSALRLIDALNHLRKSDNSVISNTVLRMAVSNRDAKNRPANSPCAATSINPRLRPKPFTCTSRPELLLATSASKTAASKQRLSAPRTKTSSPSKGDKQVDVAGLKDELGGVTLKSSAFRPYSASNDGNHKPSDFVPVQLNADVVSSSDASPPFDLSSDSWNPFLNAPYEPKRLHSKSAPHKMEERVPKDRSNEMNTCAKESLCRDVNFDENDPFAAAPFHHHEIKVAIHHIPGEHLSKDVEKFWY